MNESEYDLMIYIKTVILTNLLRFKENPTIYKNLINDPINYIKQFWEGYIQGLAENFKREDPESEPDLEAVIPSDQMYYQLSQEVCKEAVDMFRSVRKGLTITLPELAPLRLNAINTIKKQDVLITTRVKVQEISGAEYLSRRKV